jgi:hypothetical protein
LWRLLRSETCHDPRPLSIPHIHLYRISPPLFVVFSSINLTEIATLYHFSIILLIYHDYSIVNDLAISGSCKDCMELLSKCTRRHFRILKIPKISWRSMPPDVVGPEGPPTTLITSNSSCFGPTLAILVIFSFLRPCLVRAYHQIPVTPAYTRNTIQIRANAFGHRNAAQTFLRFMDQFLRGLDY